MVIALLTDFGSEDYFVGAMKGAILTVNENAKIVDLTHEIPPQDIRAANFTLRACYANFPKKTIFVAVVDPGVGSERKAILVETKNYYFIAPDNGLLSFVFDQGRNTIIAEREETPALTLGFPPSGFRVFELTNEKYFAETVSRTFHGRDVFAPIAAHLSRGVQPDEFGSKIEHFIHTKTDEPQKTSEREIEAAIIHIDRFGNLVTNLRREHLPEKFTLEINGRIINRLQNFFAEAESGALFMIAGSAGFLEVAASQNSAKEILRVKVGEKILLKAN